MLSERTASRASATPWSAASRAGADGGDSGTVCRLPAVVVMRVSSWAISAGKKMRDKPIIAQRTGVRKWPFRPSFACPRRADNLP